MQSNFNRLFNEYRATGDSLGEMLAHTFQAIIDSGEADQLALHHIRLTLNAIAARETRHGGTGAVTRLFGNTPWLDLKYHRRHDSEREAVA